MTVSTEAVNQMELRKVYNWLKISQSWLFPNRCCLCGQAGQRDRLVCRGCQDDLPWLKHCCPRCGRPGDTGGRECGQCQRQQPPIDRTVALFHYQPPISQLIQQFKFNERLTLGRLFSQSLLTRLQDEQQLPEAIIPVPLHPKRQRSRGFNQAIELARPIARNLNIPLLTDHCIRHRHTETQSELTAIQRRKNLKHAFALQRDIPYQHIAILDDVITTGTTITELARTLRRSGIQHIDCWAIARTGGKN